jgi:site-specific DNA recombinase
MSSPKNIGIWLRVSTDMQVEADSPEHHEKRARLYAEAKEWNVITVYRLDALTGKSIMDYPETKRLLTDIKNGTITGIIFSKLARLARNARELLAISDYFREHNADLISLGEAIDTSSPAGRLFFTIIAAMAQWEREEIADRVAKSVPIRANMGKPLGGQPSFGYKWENNKYVINEEEAPARKLVYELYAKERRIKAVAFELNNLGYRTRNGSKFTGTTIERLIRDTNAKGFRRANYTKSKGVNGAWELKPESEWIIQPCPALVSEELWNECNAILSSKSKRRTQVGKRPVHLFAGYVYCSCGKKMYVFTSQVSYLCKPCKRKIPASDLEEIYLQQLKPFLLIDQDVESIHAKTDQMLDEKEQQLKGYVNEVAKLKKKVQSYLDLYAEQALSKSDFTSNYAPLSEQITQLEERIPVLQADIDFIKIQKIHTDTIREESKGIHENWPNLSFDEKRSIIESITQHIIIDSDSIDISLSYQPTHADTPSSESLLENKELTFTFKGLPAPLLYFEKPKKGHATSRIHRSKQ